MSPKFHPNLLQTKNYAVPEDQQRLLEKQAVNGETAAPADELPRGVLASIKAQADREYRKRAREADSTPDARVHKAAKRRGSSPSTPVITRTTTASIDVAPPSASSPATAVSWSPSPARERPVHLPSESESGPPTKAIPSKLPAPSFPSSVPEEPLEVELPRAHYEPPSTVQLQAPVVTEIAYQSQANSPVPRGKASVVDTPPCAQPARTCSQSTDSGGKLPRKPLRSLTSLGWPTRPNSKPRYEKQFEKDRTSLSHVSPDTANPPFRSSIPSSSNNIPASIPSPPAGQSVPHPAWPPPLQPPPDNTTSIYVAGKQLPEAGKAPITTQTDDIIRILATTTAAVLANDDGKAITGATSSGEAVATTQDVSPSPTSAVSAIPATQESEKLFISFDEGSDSPFETFCKAYPAYTYPPCSGSFSAFVKACICLEYMARRRTLHQALYDDFVGAFPAYLIYNKNTPRDEALVAADWYNDRNDDVTYGKRIIDKQSLKGILGYYDTEVQEQRKRITTPAVTRQPSNSSSRVGRESSEKEPLHDTRVIASTQNESELCTYSVELSNPSHMTKEISPPPRKQRKSSFGQFDDPGEIVAKTPATQNRQASNPPLTLPPQNVSAVPSKLYKDQTAQRHSTGAIQDRTKQHISQAKAPTPGPGPGPKLSADALLYFSRLTKSRSKRDERRYSGFGRKQTSERSSLPKSDIS